LKLTISSGTPIEVDRVEVSGRVVLGLKNADGKKKDRIVVAYCMRDGEIVRGNGDDYEVSL
jgi:hypothetical protein